MPPPAENCRELSRSVRRENMVSWAAALLGLVENQLARVHICHVAVTGGRKAGYLRNDATLSIRASPRVNGDACGEGGDRAGVATAPAQLKEAIGRAASSAPMP